METAIGELHLATREHITKRLRELVQIERGQLVRLSQQLQEVLTSIEDIKKKHQAEPALLSGIVSLVSQAITYLQQAAPETVVTIPNAQTTMDRAQNQ